MPSCRAPPRAWPIPNVQTAPPLYSAYIFNPADNTFKPLFQPVEGVMITDLVAAQPRTLPAVILDKVPVIDFDPELQTQGVGILDIRSVYDFDGVDASMPDCTRSSPRWPIRRSALRRSVRRASCASRRLFPWATRTWASRTSTIPRSGASNFMREILGYVPIEPDGSVQVRVPANVAFVISILDADGRRIFALHRNWLQVRPGETRQLQRLSPAGWRRDAGPFPRS